MSRTANRAVVVIALAAMMLRALLPEGWMPPASASTGAALIICTMDGPVRMVIGNGGQPHKRPAGQHKDSHEVCPFAAAHHFATGGSTPVLAAPSVAFLAPFRSARRDTPRERDAYSAQSPRGPPFFA